MPRPRALPPLPTLTPDDPHATEHDRVRAAASLAADLVIASEAAEATARADEVSQLADHIKKAQQAAASTHAARLAAERAALAAGVPEAWDLAANAASVEAALVKQCESGTQLAWALATLAQESAQRAVDARAAARAFDQADQERWAAAQARAQAERETGVWLEEMTTAVESGGGE